MVLEASSLAMVEERSSSPPYPFRPTSSVLRQQSVGPLTLTTPLVEEPAVVSLTTNQSARSLSVNSYRPCKRGQNRGQNLTDGRQGYSISHWTHQYLSWCPFRSGRVGFEPTSELPHCRFSRPVPSTTQPPFQRTGCKRLAAWRQRPCWR